jgi:hypothetical protein
MARTITISDEHYEDALAAILEGLNEWFYLAGGDLDELMAGSPRDTPVSWDFHSKLCRIRGILEALEALNWPPETPERKEP